MFEIVSDISVERLELIFPNKESRTEFLIQDKQYELSRPVQKFNFDIKYLDKFRKRFPTYEYEIHYEKTGFLKSEAKRFSVWGVIIEREVTQSQYLYSKMNEVDKPGFSDGE